MSSTSQRSVNAIRALAIDMTQAAGSGHPGLPLGAADIGYVLYKRIMNHNPKNPTWWNRDRYIQSAGHGSSLQYSLLHLSGYDLATEELRRHRRMGSKTPGHPESHATEGVEMTTGPLGQGLASSVGFALAEAHLAATYNKPGFELFDHYTYVLASDGDIMEGVTAEAGSLAGHWGLGKLIVLYDDNDITLDTDASVSFSEDVLARYQAYGWHTSQVKDGNNVDAIETAVKAAQAVSDKPSIISIKTTIGFGAPLQGTSKVHGNPLGTEGAIKAKKTLNIDWPEFSVPEDVKADYAIISAEGAKTEAAWIEMFARYKGAHPDLAAQLERVMAGDLATDFDAELPSFPVGESMATRNASGAALNALAPLVPELMGGSADLAGSTKTDIKGEEILSKKDYAARNVYFGIREHVMAAIGNGLVLHGGVRSFVGTFLMFADYLRPSLRLGALMEAPTIFVFTHDSIGVGGDGPTHQPIGTVMSLRAIPNVTVIRPGDANESVQAWVEALKNTHGPTALVFTRQNIPNLDVPAGSVAKGAYILADSESAPEVILMASGSEVYKCLEAKEKLESEGVAVRVVSVPSFELFEKQEASYQEQVFPHYVKTRVAMEAGASQGWYKFTGLDGAVIGIDRFGESAEGDEIMELLGLTSDNLVKTVKDLLKRQG